MTDNVSSRQEGQIATRMGAAFLGERVVLRGLDLHHDLGRRSWLEVYAYGITGRLFEASAIELMNYLWVATSYPEPRIWCNRIAAIAGSARSTALLGTSAALAVTEANVYGIRAMKKCLDFLQRAAKAVQEGEILDAFIETEIAQQGTIYGYGRPLVGVDERIPHVLQFLRDKGMPLGVHARLCFDVDAYFRREKKLGMNAAALYSALMADLGFSAHEYYVFMMGSLLAGMPPCFLDTEAKPEGDFLPVSCAAVVYQGAAPRRWEDG